MFVGSYCSDWVLALLHATWQGDGVDNPRGFEPISAMHIARLPLLQHARNAICDLLKSIHMLEAQPVRVGGNQWLPISVSGWRPHMIAALAGIPEPTAATHELSESGQVTCQAGVPSWNDLVIRHVRCATDDAQPALSGVIQVSTAGLGAHTVRLSQV